MPPFAFVKAGAEGDRIWNGADDDGSGTVAMMALAKAFAEGPRPRRSLLFVWHTGEESGRYGSLYFADHPTVPIENVVAQLNIDMIGRNRDNSSSESNTVYLVGSERISSELHAINLAANESMQTPLKLAYDYNDPSDPNCTSSDPSATPPGHLISSRPASPTITRQRRNGREDRV